MAENEGLIQVQSGIIPNGDNPRAWTVKQNNVQGSDQTFGTVNELIAFHPNIMGKAGITAKVINYPTSGVTSEFQLNTNPQLLLDTDNESIITLENFRDYWDLKSETNSSKTRVYQYAPDGPGGSAPSYPYTPETEATAGWDPVDDTGKGYRWIRWRDDDIDLNDDGVYDNWTPPVPKNQAYAPKDYIDNRYKRVAVSNAQHTALGTMTVSKFYIVISGILTVNGDAELERKIGADGSGNVSLGAGRRFQYKGDATYTFNGSIVKETIEVPPRTISNGQPNNEPSGFSDEIPEGTDQLFQITGQKSVYNQLKNEWILIRVEENPNYTRYSNQAVPHPDSIAGVNDTITDGNGFDTALIAAGWSKVYSGQQFIARRYDDPGANDYTVWAVDKINEESGEYTDEAFKLFDINLDPDDSNLQAPVDADPSDEGFTSTPQEETELQINYRTTARKFSDGTLKTPWSPLIPYTGKSIFNDVIDTDGDNSFKRSATGVVSPDQIILTAELYKGLSKLWENEDIGISYTWKKVYDNGSSVNISPTDSSGDNFYQLASSGTFRDDQRVVVKPGAVTGKAVFRCTQTLTISSGNTIDFVEEFTISDISDGIDAKSLVARADQQLFIYDTSEDQFSPGNIVIRAYSSNIPSPTYNWYRNDSGAWTALTGEETGYTIVGNKLVVDLATAGLWAGDATVEEVTFAVSTDDTDPDNANNSTIFTDIVSVSKTSSNAVGQNGEPAITALLDNESHAITINSITGAAVSGEIGSSGKALTTLQVFEGATKLVYGGGNDYTIALVVTGNMTADKAANGNDVDIFIDTFSDPFPGSAVVKITITHGAKAYIKTFSVSTIKDPPGAIQLDIDSNKGFSFTPKDRTDKTLTANLYDTNLDAIDPQTSGYEYRWKVAGSFGSWSTSRTKTLTRANVFVSEDIVLEARIEGETDLLRSDIVRVNDIIDSKTFRLFSVASTKPAKPAEDIDPYVGAGTWITTDSDSTVWVVEGTERSGAAGLYDWNEPYRRSNAGTPGENGGFFHPIYIASETEPDFGAGDDTSTLAQMIAAGWGSKRPLSGIIWQTERLFEGDGVSFDVNGNPDTDPFTGSFWQPAIRLTGTDGSSTPGEDGSIGWSPEIGVESSGLNRYLKLVDFFGGTGTKPTENIGKYFGENGYVANIGLATNFGAGIVFSHFTGLNFMIGAEDDDIDDLPQGTFIIIQSSYFRSTGISSNYNVIGITKFISQGTILKKESSAVLRVLAYGPYQFKLPFIFQSSGNQYIDPASSILMSSTYTTVKTVSITNNNNQEATRKLRIRGLIGLAEDNNSDIVQVGLRKVRSTGTIIGLALNRCIADTGSPPNFDAFHIEAVTDINYGETWTFQLSAQNVNGGNNYRTEGYIEAYSLDQ